MLKSIYKFFWEIFIKDCNKNGGVDMRCSICGKEIEEYEYTYQIRYGFRYGKEFIPDQDVGYICVKCFNDKFPTF